MDARKNKESGGRRARVRRPSSAEEEKKSAFFIFAASELGPFPRRADPSLFEDRERESERAKRLHLYSQPRFFSLLEVGSGQFPATRVIALP